MKRWKWFLLIGILLFIFTTFYTKFTSDRVIREVRDYLENNDFMHYSLTEYIEYFKINNFETDYAAGEEYLIDKAQYGSVEDYSNNCFDIYGLKDGGNVSLEYSESNDESFRFGMYKIKAVDADGLPLIYGVEWDDTYEEVKRKMGLNILNESIPYLLHTYLPYFGIVSNGPIRSRNTEEMKFISLVTDNIDNTYYNYVLYFDETDKLEEIVILSDKQKLQ